jgi:tetratricopeptide (TPR) repeat protein
LPQIEKYWSKTFDNWNFYTAGSLYLLSVYYVTIKDYGNADRILTKCLSGLVPKYGSRNKELRPYLCLLAETKDGQSKYDEAIKNANSAIEISESIHLLDAEYFRALTMLWKVNMDRKNFKQAETVMKGFIKKANNSSLLAEGYYLLSTVYGAEGNTDKRIETDVAGLKVLRALKEPDSLHLASFERELSSIYLAIDNLADASKYAQEAINDSEKITVQPDRNREIGDDRLQLARVQVKQNNYVAASDSFKKAAENYEKLGKKYEPFLYIAISDWAEAAKASKQDKEAQALTARANALKKMLPGP